MIRIRLIKLFLLSILLSSCASGDSISTKNSSKSVSSNTSQDLNELPSENTSTPTSSENTDDDKISTSKNELADTGNELNSQAAQRKLKDAPSRFNTLSPGSNLPDGDECAAWVKSAPENVPENTPYNQTKGFKVPGITYLSINTAINKRSGFDKRIDGNFTGTTDEIIQWGACKWGFDEDHVRAQAYTESSWFAGKLGDCGEDTQPRTGGKGGCASFGLMQIRGAEIANTNHPGLYPIAWESTAMNVDYALAIKRLCFEGEESWLNDVSNDSYEAGDEWACAGRWFSGGWKDSDANRYISVVKENLKQRQWETQYVGCKSWDENFYCNNSGIKS